MQDLNVSEVGRRGLLKAAAWSVPVVVAAASAPVAAASPCVPPFVDWSWKSTNAQFNLTEAGKRPMVNGSGEAFYIRADQVGAGLGYVHLYTPIEVEQGRTYNFQFMGLQNGGGGGKNPATRTYVILGMRTLEQVNQNIAPSNNWVSWIHDLNMPDGTGRIWWGSSHNVEGGPQIKYVEDGKEAPYSSTPGQSYSATYVATVTTTLYLTMSWVLVSTGGAWGGVNDDISLTIPTVLCS